MTVLPCDLPEREKLTAERETFLDRVSDRVLYLWHTMAVRSSLEWVWLAEAMEPFTKMAERLKYRAEVSRGRLKWPPDLVS